MRSIQVMTVDDCAVSRRVVKLLLRDQLGVEVVAEAASFEEARAGLIDGAIDVIVLDLNLPDAMGLSLVERLRSCVRGIVVVSGNTEYHLEALKLGAAACIEKSRLLDEKARLVRSIHQAAGIRNSTGLLRRLRVGHPRTAIPGRG